MLEAASQDLCPWSAAVPTLGCCAAGAKWLRLSPNITAVSMVGGIQTGALPGRVSLGNVDLAYQPL